ncbi:MAG: hypothetical protein ABIM22_04720 [candidate division WOR-3 bacterium]
MYNFLNDLFKRFSAESVRYVILRNYEGLPGSNSSKDIDIGILRRDLRVVHKILLNAAKKCGFTHYIVHKWYTIYCYTFYSPAETIKIDVIVGFQNRGRIIISDRELILQRRSKNGFYIPDEVHEAAILILKSLFTGRPFVEKYAIKVKEVIRIKEVCLKVILQRVLPRDLTNNIIKRIQIGAPLRLERKLYISYMLSYVKAMFNSPLGFLLNLTLHIISELLKFFDRAYIIAVLGPDGSGKSTFAHNLKKKLVEKLKISEDKVIYFHFRPAILPNLGALFGRKSYQDSIPYTKPPASYFSSFFRLMYYCADFIFGYFVKVLPQKRNYSFFIFDRYAHEFVCDPYRSRIRLPLTIRKAIFYFVPKPVCTFILIANPEIILARKKELSFEQVVKLNASYQRLESKNVYFLDASFDPDQLTENACKIIFKAIGKKL